MTWTIPSRWFKKMAIAEFYTHFERANGQLKKATDGAAFLWDSNFQLTLASAV
jgi:hypothetical protein